MSKENRAYPVSHWVKDAKKRSEDYRFYMVGHIASEVGEIWSALQKGDLEGALDETKDAMRGLEILREVLEEGEDTSDKENG
jgi:hypothetical protein